jgi:hypothetical protein
LKVIHLQCLVHSSHLLMQPINHKVGIWCLYFTVAAGCKSDPYLLDNCGHSIWPTEMP